MAALDEIIGGEIASPTIFAQTPSNLVHLPQRLRERLLTTPIRDITPCFGNIIGVRSSDSVATLFRTLIDNSIFCAVRSFYLQIKGVTHFPPWLQPVYDETSLKYVGFLDVFDIFSYAVGACRLNAEESENWLLSPYLQERCTVLLRHSKRTEWQVINMNDPIQAAINKLLHFRRLGVVNTSGTLVAVLTQNIICRWLASMPREELGELGPATIGSLKLGLKKVQTVGENESVVTALLKMYQLGISSLAVCSEDGKLLEYPVEMFRKLYVSCLDFVKIKAREHELPRIATESTTVNSLLEQYKKSWIERIYILDQNEHPVGVITLTDILGLFSN